LAGLPVGDPLLEQGNRRWNNGPTDERTGIPANGQASIRFFFGMIGITNRAKQIRYFAVPFLILSILILLNQWRISRPDTALQTARDYLEGQFPGTKWELGKLASVGEGPGKKWRLEFGSIQGDGRRIQANLLVDRLMPGRIVGKFIILFSPPQIDDREGNRPTLAEHLFSRISRMGFFLAGFFLLALQLFWLYRTRRGGHFGQTDGILLAGLGGMVMAMFMVLGIHPAVMIAYSLIFTFLGVVACPPGAEKNGRE
jgi:hypothetical protein